MTRYVTVDGVVLNVGRVDRRLLDNVVLNLNKPEPPVREITVWDGSTEKVQIIDDPEYQRELSEYYYSLKEQEFGIIETAVQIDDETHEIHAQGDELHALRMLGITNEQRPLMNVLMNQNDATAVVSLIYYNSTVTPQGIDEANVKFGAVWEGQPVSSYRFKEQFPIGVSQYYIDRIVSNHFNFKWHEFCELHGSEQSEYVALYTTYNALEYMKQKHMEAKAK